MSLDKKDVFVVVLDKVGGVLGMPCDKMNRIFLVVLAFDLEFRPIWPLRKNHTCNLEFSPI